MAEYDVTNDFDEDTYIRVEDIDIYGDKATPLTKILPGGSDRVWGSKTIQVRAISGAEEVDCRIGLNTSADIDYRLTLKRDGKMWLLKDLVQPVNMQIQQNILDQQNILQQGNIQGQENIAKQVDRIPRPTENPIVIIGVGPNGQ